jgi:hypothetical protein
MHFTSSIPTIFDIYVSKRQVFLLIRHVLGVSMYTFQLNMSKIDAHLNVHCPTQNVTKLTRNVFET